MLSISDIFFVSGTGFLFGLIILTDLGIFALMIDSFPNIYVMIYLLVIHTFYGAVDAIMAYAGIMRMANAFRKTAAPYIQ